MNKELQDKAWACLPKEVREEIRDLYISLRHASDELDGKDNGLLDIIHKFESILGKINLQCSIVEPKEMLIVERGDIINRYNGILAQRDPKNFGYSAYNQGQKDLLDKLFGDKCLPDKESSVQVESKFKVGDKAKHNDMGIVCIQEVIHLEDEYRYSVNRWLDGTTMAFEVAESDLEPYTEPETNDNMEEKELNLAELLKDCEGGIYFCPTRKEPIVVEHAENGYKVVPEEEAKKMIDSFTVNPDFYSAWQKWKEARKPKRWYPQHGEEVWHLDLSMKPKKTYSRIPYSQWEGELNCFQTEELCKQAAEAVRKCLEKFHEKNSEK